MIVPTTMEFLAAPPGIPTLASRWPRSPTVGAALTYNRITVALPGRAAWRGGGARLYECSLDPQDQDGGWRGLESALTEIREAIGATVARLRIALQRPLCRVRTFALPNLPAAELRRIIEQDPGRFFAGQEVRVFAEVERLRPRGLRRAPPRCIVSVADAPLVESILQACESAGFHEPLIVPGAVSVAAAACTLAPKLRTGSWACVVLAADSQEILFLRRGALRTVRSVPSPPLAPGPAWGTLESRFAGAEGERFAREHCRIAELLAESVRFEAGHVDRIGITSAGGSSPCPAGGPAACPMSCEPLLALEGLRWSALAAVGAAILPRTAACIRPPAVRHEAHHRARTRALALFALVVVTLGCTAGLRLWDLRRELRAVDLHRASLRPTVEEVVHARAALRTVEAILAALEEREAARQRWAAVFSEISATLPTDAFMIAFAADQATVRLDLRARSAAGVVAAFQESGQHADVSLAAPVRRDGAYPFTERLVLQLSAYRRNGPTTEPARPSEPLSGAGPTRAEREFLESGAAAAAHPAGAP